MSCPVNIFRDVSLESTPLGLENSRFEMKMNITSLINFAPQLFSLVLFGYVNCFLFLSFFSQVSHPPSSLCLGFIHYKVPLSLQNYKVPLQCTCLFSHVFVQSLSFKASQHSSLYYFLCVNYVFEYMYICIYILYIFLYKLFIILLASVTV